MCQFWTLDAFSGSPKNSGINFRGLHFSIASNKKDFYKNQITQKANYKNQKLNCF